MKMKSATLLHNLRLCCPGLSSSQPVVAKHGQTRRHNAFYNICGHCRDFWKPYQDMDGKLKKGIKGNQMIRFTKLRLKEMAQQKTGPSNLF